MDALKGTFDMKLIGKIFALPFILVLTLFVAVLGFLLSIAGWIFSLAATLLGVLGVLSLVTGGPVSAGIAAIVMAFLISPFGLPAAADWIIDKLADLTYSLKCFVAG